MELSLHCFAQCATQMNFSNSTVGKPPEERREEANPEVLELVQLPALNNTINAK